MAERLNILLTCIGRRVSLLGAFRRAMKDVGVEGAVLGADRSAWAPGLYRAEEGFLVPAVHSSEYVEALLDICRRREVGLVIPLLDWELAVLAEARGRFEEAGARMLISSPRVVGICRDKEETFNFLTKLGLGTPKIFRYEEALGKTFPLFMKPRYGSSAKDVHKLDDRDALEFYRKRTPESVVQEFVDGQEYTVDVYASLADGVPRAAVPRERLVVREGEVSKARTVRHRTIIAQSMELVAALNECVGVVTIQCFLTPSGEVKFIEVNPRFGGGVPLAIRAGANFPRWIIQEHLGRKPDIDPDGWQDQLLMLRYDEAVFRPRDELLG